jgi:uncharacterized protein (TIGR04255 family)
MPLPPVDSPVTFKRPPVAEVAIAIQLAQPATDDTTTLGVYWPRIRETHPQLQPQTGLPPMSEDFDGPAASPGVAFQVFEGSPPTRYWLLNPDSTELVQVQPDRFVFNWRKEPADVDYPRYTYLRSRFVDLYSTFIEAVGEVGNEVVPAWCEITYVNPIAPIELGAGRPDIGTILRRFNSTEVASSPALEDTSFSERFLLERDGSPYGRFYVTARPTFRVTDQVPIYVVTLVVRGRPRTPSLEGALAFLDEGRALIVNSFRDMTTDAMHEQWGLQDD